MAMSRAQVKLWDVATGEELATLTGFRRMVWSVAFSPDGRWLAASSNDFSIKLWDAATGQVRATLRGPGQARPIAFSPDGKTLAAGASQWRSDALGRRPRQEPGHPRCP